MSKSLIEESDIPLILELSLTLSNVEIAKIWETTSSNLCNFLASRGYKIGEHRRRDELRKVDIFLDLDMTGLEIAEELKVSPSKASKLIREAKYGKPEKLKVYRYE